MIPHQFTRLPEEEQEEEEGVTKFTAPRNLASYVGAYIMSVKSGTSKWSLSLFIRTRSWYFWASLILAMLLPTLILGTALTLLPRVLAADGPTVDLGYAKYQGTSKANINKFLGIRYAAAPVGDLRFRGPKPPKQEDKLIQADKVSYLEL